MICPIRLTRTSLPLKAALEAARPSPCGERYLAYMRDLAGIRQRHIVPRIAGNAVPDVPCIRDKDGIIAVDWQFGRLAWNCASIFCRRHRPFRNTRSADLHAATRPGARPSTTASWPVQASPSPLRGDTPSADRGTCLEPHG